MSGGESSATLRVVVGGRLKVATWNVNGLRAVVKRGDLERFLAAEKPDVLLLQEIKMNEAIPGFSEYVKFDSF